ncbi:MAG TPA: dienelactone hydrolase [Rhizobiales bacterium]|nr:dienelactone hydrolase [Hyphomicrobiales bacterium]
MAKNRIDLIRPDAPELAMRGSHPIGVTTHRAVNSGQPDTARAVAGRAVPLYDRPFTLEVWYPAEVAAGTPPTPYENVLLRDGETRTTLHGQAVRDAAPAPVGPCPLVILSHGYPGNRFLMSHLGENLASKGYVVASIDHADSTYDDQGAFASTLVNRPLDQAFALDEMERLSRTPGGRLSGMVDASRAALVGYSMGGYGVVVSAGGGLAPAAATFEWAPPHGLLSRHVAGSPEQIRLPDPRFRAFVAIAPWGMEKGLWDAAGLAGIKGPILFVAGDADDISGYAGGVKKLFDLSTGADRLLLTFENANHNAAAPIPAPAEAWFMSDKIGFPPFEHYADPVWDTVRMNNVAQHFLTAFLGLHVKGDRQMAPYLEICERAAEGIWSTNDDGTPRPDHTYWKGFRNRTAIGLRLSRAAPGKA